MPENTPNLDSIFREAAKIESTAQRAAYLDKSCGDNLELREQAEQLLHADLQASEFLANPGSAFDETIDPSSLQSKVTGENLSASRDVEMEMEFSLNDAVEIGDTSRSVLRSLGNTIAEFPQVSLHESAAQGDDPVAMPSSPEMPLHDADSRYRLDGEIARGGMGAIIKGRDTDLGRDLAIKVLLDSHKEKPEVIQRFVEEAQINGQLQHPGIAPVYELGQFKDKRPFFAMKLVKGQTLSKLLSDREDAAEMRSKFIGIFEQICQTVAYAHSRRVIHRDLKPANIMVGAFGEVQVMDWGLAKVLQTGGVADEKRSKMLQQDHSIIQTLRSGGDGSSGLTDFGSVGSAGSQTQMGSVMGTPAYMPPEQALGEIDNMDERADVFGLGAILCEILTGKPPYVADTGMEVYRMASRCKLGDAFSRLDACGADADLIAMTRQCLEVELVDRPRDASVVADRMTGYLQSVQQKLRDAEVERAAEAARATAEVKRRRTSLALATSLLLLVALGSGGWLYLERGEANRQAAEAKAQRTHAAEMQAIAEQRDVQRKTAEQAQAAALTAQQQAERARSTAEAAKQVAQDAEEAGRQLLYATDMQLAPLIWADDAATVPQFLDRLDRHDPKVNVALEGKPDLRGFEWHYGKHLIDAGAEIYEGHNGGVIAAAFDAAGKFITLDSTFQLRHWDRETQQVISTWNLKEERSAKKAILSSNGQLVAISVGDEVQVLDVDTRELRFKIDIASKQRLKMLFSEDCKVLVTNDSQIRWWNTTDGTSLGAKKIIQQHRTDDFSISQDGLVAARFCWGHGEGDFYRLDLADPEAAQVRVRRRRLYASALEFFPNGRNFVIGLRTSGGLSIYNAETQRQVATTSSHSAPIYSIGFSSDGKKMACAANDGMIKVWGVTQKKDAMELTQLASLKGHRDKIRRIFFSPDNQSIVSCGADGTARIWDLNRKASAHYRLDASRSTKYTYSPNGLLIAGTAKGKIDFWGAATGRKVRTLFDKNITKNDVVAFSPDHRLLAVGGHKSVWLWDLDTGRKTRQLHDDFQELKFPWRTSALAFSPDGKQLATAFGQNPDLNIDGPRPPKIWDVASGRMVASLEGHTGECTALQFSGDGSRLATASFDSTAKIWNTTTWQSIRELRNPDAISSNWGGLITDIAFSKDGNQLAIDSFSSGSERKSFFLWDAAAGDEMIRIDGHANTVTAVSFSPAGQTLATVSQDNTLRLWNVATRQQLMKIDSTARTLSFSPDGDQLLASNTIIPTRSSIWLDPERAANKLDELLQADIDFASRIRLFSENLRLHESVAVLQQRHPDDQRVQAALAATKANWYASNQRWAKAAGEFVKLQKLDSDRSHAWLRTAGLLRVARALFEQNQAASASELVHAASKQWQTAGLWETKVFSESRFGKQMKTLRSEVKQRLKTNASDQADHSDKQNDSEAEALSLLLAEVEGLMGNAPMQIEAYTAAIELLSDQPLGQTVGKLKKLYLRRADAFMKQRQWQSALDDYNQVVTDETNNELLLTIQALVTANVLLDDPQASTMKIEDPWTRLSVAQTLAGQKDRAIQSFERALQTAIGVQAKQAVLEQANRFDDFAAQLVAEHPRDPEIQYAWARVLLRQSRDSFRRKPLPDALVDMKRSCVQLEKTLALNPENSHAAHMLTKLTLGIDDGHWTVLTPAAGGMESKGGASLKLHGDGSILASGKNPERETYAITTNVPFKRIRAIRLEAIPDWSLPRHSSGRGGKGRFCVTELSVLINGKPHRLDAVVVSHPGIRSYQKMIDQEIDAEAWEFKNRIQERHFAVLPTDLELADDDTLTFEIVCASSESAGRNLGRFRLSVSDDPNAYAKAERQFAALNIIDPAARLEVVNALVGQGDPAIDCFSPAIGRTRNVETMQTLVQLASSFDGLLPKLADRHPDNPGFQYALGQFNAQSGDMAASKKARPLLEAILKADPQDVVTADRLADLLVDIQNAEDESQWKVMKPSQQNLTSSGGATLTILDDDSVLASGKNADQDAYRITTNSQLRSIKAIRLEVIPDPSLPKNGPGRYRNGNFHLSNINVFINGTQQTADEVSVSNSPISNNDKVQAIINGSNPREYWWGAHRHIGQRSTAIVVTDLQLADGDKLTLELLTSRGKYPQHNLGRFRLSVTDNPHAYANSLKRFAYRNAVDPWAKLAIAYDLIGYQAASDRIIQEHPQVTSKNAP